MTAFPKNYPPSSSPTHPHSGHSLLYQREQISQTCCFVNTLIQRREHTPSARQEYARSVTAKSKQKKINLLIAKKGTSLQKNRNAGITLTKHIPVDNYRSCKIIRAKADPPYPHTTIGSKDVTQKNSLCSSRLHPEQMLKIQQKCTITPLPRPYQPQQTYPIKPTNEMTFVHTRDMSNMPLLSDITLVEQQFISHGSTTLNALNYLYSCNTEKSRFCEQPNSTIKMISNYPMKQDAVKQFKNPLERLIERKIGNVFGSGTQRKRLVL